METYRSGWITVYRMTPWFWPITGGLTLLCAALGWVFSFSYIGVGFFAGALMFLVATIGAVASRWTPRIWHAYALLSASLMALLILLGCFPQINSNFAH